MENLHWVAPLAGDKIWSSVGSGVSSLATIVLKSIIAIVWGSLVQRLPYAVNVTEFALV